MVTPPAPPLARHAAPPPPRSPAPQQGLRYPADPPRIEEIVAVMRCAGDTTHGFRTRALIVLLWRAGLRISEALALAESDLDVGRGGVLVRQGKGGKRREAAWTAGAGSSSSPGWNAACSCPSARCCASSTDEPLPRPWAPAVRETLWQLAVTAGVRRRFAPHQLRHAHAHAVEMAREGVPLNVIQGQLGHASFGVTSVYLQSIDNSEIIDTVHARPAPMLPASAGLASRSRA